MNNICIHPFTIRNGYCDYREDEYSLCDDKITHFGYRKHIAFVTICDGFTELSLITINARNGTKNTTNEDKNIMIAHLPTIRQYEQRYHRRLDIRIWLNNTQNLTTRICLCPSILSDDRC
jgi:hypothetical protein